MVRKSALLLLGVTLLLTACEGELMLSENGSEGFVNPSNPGGGGSSSAEDGPETSLHRLNRLEYNNAMRDLLGTQLSPADDFPPDAALGGFDNSKQALGVTPTLMGQYVEGARVVVEDAFLTRPAVETRFEEDDERLTFSIDRDTNSIGGIIRLRGGRADATLVLPEAGRYTVTLRNQGLTYGAAAAPALRLQVGGQTFDYVVPAQMTETTQTLDLSAGQHELVIAATNFEENAAENRGNDILIDYLVVRSERTIDGPMIASLECDLGETACRQDTVLSFGRKAWRRPLEDSEQTSLTQLLAGLIADGESPLEAVKLTLRAILSSSKFLYRYRTTSDPNGSLLAPYVLASRLSFFVWSSVPDDRLLAAAEAGSLATRAGVEETVAWMLEDPKAQALADGFAEQWLDIRHLEQAAPSAELFPSFNEDLRDSMAQESKLFFMDYLTNGATVASMLQPNFAYRDAALAEHLGVEAPSAARFERLEVGEGDRRGVLALSAWLTSRSESEHSSPIRRGAWVADNMLCSPVPPPPPGLEVAELAGAESNMTLRERLEQHRNDPACATCHANLDVLGMGFETYDAAGRELDNPNLDSIGEIGTSGTFRGAEELANKMDQQAFVACVAKKLMTYAVGRPVRPAEVEQIEGVASPSLTMPALITSIVLAPVFSKPLELK